MKSRIYDMECPECGHFLRDNHIWVRCLNCAEGRYDIVMEYPAGI